MAPQVITLPNEELDWIKIREDCGLEAPETQKEKLLRKIKENPLVPIGCIGTAFALCFGLYNFRTGNAKMSQIMMRTRIAAQGFTVFALVAGVMTAYSKKD